MNFDPNNTKPSTSQPKPETTHFGYREVPIREKSNLVKNVFQSVASKYDLMNDLMSLGLHRLWKRLTIQEAGVRPGQKVLDLASGTGDLALALAREMGTSGTVIMSDINEAMLNIGRDRLIDQGVLHQVKFVQASAEQLPFADHEFDCITIAFGLRNVTDKDAALRAMFRVLKPGGKVLILEFSHPSSSIVNKLYELYSFNVIPKLGEIIANDRESYQYLVESIRQHPNQESLKAMMVEAGFEDVEYTNVLDGIVALHKGYKY